MEAPNPINYLVPENKENYNRKFSLKVESNLKKKYSIEILSYGYFLEINIKLINNIQNFSKKFLLEEIKTINRYFLICESISEVLISIEQNINQLSLIEEKDQIKLIIPLNHPFCKEAVFIIPEEIKIFDSKELYHIISELKSCVKKQQKIILKQQEDIKNLRERIEILEQRSNLRENKFMDLKSSHIIPNDYDKEKAIKNWINPLGEVKLDLLFRMTRDGSKSSDFHKFCDNKGPTLTLVQTDKGYKFGGYTPYSWKSELGNSPENDIETFLFSLDLMKKFKKIKDGPTLYFDEEFGPCFGEGGSDFFIEKNLSEGCSTYGNFLNNFELTNGEKGDFNVKELEIYKVMNK